MWLWLMASPMASNVATMTGWPLRGSAEERLAAMASALNGAGVAAGVAATMTLAQCVA